jgi:hypothetical protein
VKEGLIKRYGIKSLFFLGCSFLAGCVYILHKSAIETEMINFSTISTPIKAHLNDGTTILFKQGARYQNNQLIGDGLKFSVDLKDTFSIDQLDMEDVAAYEVFRREVDTGGSIALSLLATGGAIVGASGLMVAIFGSCPTIYSDHSGTDILESELFSNSIAPMLEARDLTRLKVTPDSVGVVRLEVRNEALETHYINHLELLSVTHNQGSFAVPDIRGRALSLSSFLKMRSAVNSAGDDIAGVLGKADMDFYSTGAFDYKDEISWDYIELTYEAPKSDKAALHIRGRNTLFSTVYLYDFLLAGRGLQAVDWLGRDLGTVSEAVALGDFHNRYMGIRVDQLIDGEYQEVAKLGNTGPIAWKDRALELDVSNLNPTDSLKIRLRFLSDSWQIDQIQMASNVTKPEIQSYQVARILNSSGEHSQDHLSLIRSPDDQYLVTYPGNRFFMEFDTKWVSNEYTQEFMLVGQGYYIEWIRQHWIEDSDPFFEPDYSDSMLVRVQNHWMNVKEEFEKEFFESKIPVQ